MSDSSQSYGDGDSEHEEEHNHHQPSGFSQRFGAMAKFPSALKKVVTRERINSNEEQTEYHHEKVCTNKHFSFQSMNIYINKHSLHRLARCLKIDFNQLSTNI